MDIPNKIFTFDYDELELVPIGDLHVGSIGFNEKHLKSVVDYIVSQPFRYTVLLGDLINNSTKSSVANVYEEKINPDEQIDKLVDYLSPLKGRILASVSGNHEKRTYKESGVDVSKLIAKLLEVPLYSSNIAILDINIGTKGIGMKKRRNFTIGIAHGKGAGRLFGSRLNNAMQIAELIPNLDIYILAHGHTQTVTNAQLVEWDNRNKTTKDYCRWFVTVPSFVHNEDYALERFLVSSKPGIVSISLRSIRDNEAINIVLK